MMRTWTSVSRDGKHCLRQCTRSLPPKTVYIIGIIGIPSSAALVSVSTRASVGQLSAASPPVLMAVILSSDDGINALITSTDNLYGCGSLSSFWAAASSFWAASSLHAQSALIRTDLFSTLFGDVRTGLCPSSWSFTHATCPCRPPLALAAEVILRKSLAWTARQGIVWEPATAARSHSLPISAFLSRPRSTRSMKNVAERILSLCFPVGNIAAARRVRGISSIFFFFFFL
jgi:hypothetical protein